MKISFCSKDRHYFQEDAEELLNLSQDKMQISSWQNEQVILPFAVVAEEDLGEVKISVENASPVLKTQLKMLEFTQAHIGRGMTYGNIVAKPNRQVADIVKPYAPTALKKGEFRIFWLIIEGEHAGVSTGEIHIFAENEVKILKFDYEILPISLNEETTSLFSLELWQYPQSLARFFNVNWFSTEHLNLIKENLLAYKQAGGNTIAVTILHDPWNHQTYDISPSLVKWQMKNGKLSFDFTDFDRYVKLNLSVGISEKIKSFSLLPWEDRMFYFDEKGELIEEKVSVGSEKWFELWSQFLPAYIEHLEEMGWFEQTYIAFDERESDALEQAVRLVKKYKSSKGETLKLSGAINYTASNLEIFDELDEISISQAQIQSAKEFRQLANDRRKKGKTTAVYNCVGDYPSIFALSQPIETRFLMWYFASLTADCFLRWALDAWTENPLKALNHWYWEAGDSLLLYPHEKEETTPYSSVRFEQMKQGLTSVRKYLHLKSLDETIVSEIEGLLFQMTLPKGAVNEYGASVSGDDENDLLMEREVGMLEEVLERVTREFVGR
ncbi:protein of unknown function [Pilibacter termitis]|uniref:Glycoside hydrolase 123 catalytic domain-containing protein n=1 Tax=Pilibacter termitis TaxID=263852 RepID=A0A1T4QQK8_9ENTE|nr:DUF4091 domain-containing protein [Pilibacter termitis]SKA06059.1 protein of unknown function [Pilibacter termitis]